MEIPLYLAMTAAELQNAAALPPRLAWMACHFSAYGTGLSNIPRTLPPGSMLMLNDRTPICGHDPELVAQTLCNAAKNLDCNCIVLDFQGKDCNQLFDVIQRILQLSSCPVGVSALYAADFDCPVLVPPIPPHLPPDEALVPWKGRELWMELSAEGTEISVTEAGSRYTPLSDFVPSGKTHPEETLHCHYTITVEDKRILFQLGRTEEDHSSLLKSAKTNGVTKSLGLWQEMQSGRRLSIS